MHTYRVELNLLQGPTVEPSSEVTNPISDTAKLNSAQTKGFKGFYFSGGDKAQNSGCWLDGSYKFFSAAEGYPGWVGNSLSDANGNFAVEQSITLTSAQPISTLVIRFDDVAGEYATKITIGNTVYTNNSYVFIANITPTNNVKVIFTQWSKVNSLAKILTLSADIVLSYDIFALQGLTFTEKCLNNAENLSFGIVMQTGSFTVLDKLGWLCAANNAGILVTGLEARIIKDDVQVQTLIVEDIDSDTLSETWTFSLTDDMTNWEEDLMDGVYYADRNLKQIVDMLIPGIVYDDGLDLSVINIPNSFLRSTSRYENLVKCCNVGLFQVYKFNGVYHARSLI